ncbi:MAG: hypothetical protein KTR28_04175 [Micavibrio sp.]|nr:hypothetical protein [Micavibrio sp.]
MYKAGYKAGDDVNFKPDHDVPADINPLNASPGAILIPIEINLAQRYGLVLPAGTELKPVVSSIAIYPDGRIEYNGQDVSQKVEEICESDVQVDRQAASDIISSPPIVKKKAAPPVRGGSEVIKGEVLQGQYPQD